MLQRVPKENWPGHCLPQAFEDFALPTRSTQYLAPALKILATSYRQQRSESHLPVTRGQSRALLVAEKCVSQLASSRKAALLLGEKELRCAFESDVLSANQACFPGGVREQHFVIALGTCCEMEENFETGSISFRACLCSPHLHLLF